MTALGIALVAVYGAIVGAAIVAGRLVARMRRAAGDLPTAGTPLFPAAPAAPEIR